MRTLLVGAIAALALTANAAAEQRNLRDFTGVAASDRIEVEITVGESYSVDVSGSDTDKVSTRVDGDTLRIRRTNRPWWGGTPSIDATVRVTMPALNSIAASRGAEVNATGVAARGMSISASMGGSARAAGTCETLDASVSMGGSINAEALECGDADVSASMGGDARVYASRHFSASASMGGAVNVAGEGARGDVSTSMGGSVNNR